MEDQTQYLVEIGQAVTEEMNSRLEGDLSRNTTAITKAVLRGFLRGIANQASAANAAWAEKAEELRQLLPPNVSLPDSLIAVELQSPTGDEFDPEIDPWAEMHGSDGGEV
jgi:hypothetical protein